MFREAALTALNDNVDYTCLYNLLPLIFFLRIVYYDVLGYDVGSYNQIKSNQIFIAPLQQDHNMAIVYKLQYMDIYTYTRQGRIQGGGGGGRGATEKNPGIHFYSGFRGNAQVGIDFQKA